MSPVSWPSMRSIARWVLPVLVGPSTAVTLRMRAARSRLIRTCPQRATGTCSAGIAEWCDKIKGGSKKTATAEAASSPLSSLRFVVDASLSLPAIAGAVLRHALDGDDLLAFLGLEYAHALRVASGDAHVVHRHADELAGVGDQHDLIALLDGKRSNERAVALVDDHSDDAFAAAAGDTVVVR